MIAKYPGMCIFCKKPIEVGVDTYDVEIKKSYHAACKEDYDDDQPPSPDALRLAQQLGYVRHDQTAIGAAIPAWRLRQDWALRHLLDGDRSHPAGRLPAPAYPQSNAPLFDEAKGVK